jgi:hypothetical protein
LKFSQQGSHGICSDIACSDEEAGFYFMLVNLALVQVLCVVLLFESDLWLWSDVHFRRLQ